MIKWIKSRFSKSREQETGRPATANRNTLSDSTDESKYLKILGDVSGPKNYNTTLSIVFYRLEDVMKKDKPFLDRGFSLEKLAGRAGTNRTYASKEYLAKFGNPKNMQLHHQAL